MRRFGLWMVLLFAGCGGAATTDMAPAATDMALPGDLTSPADLLPDAFCGPLTLTGQPDCDACLATQCCTVIRSCAGDGGCAGVWDHSAVVECTQNACAGACNHAPAKCGGITATPQSCATCVHQHCCAEATACAMNDACLALIYQCLDRDSGDYPTCEDRYPAGAMSFVTLNDCGTNNCPGCF